MVGINGPALTGPCEVATKKLTSEPAVKPVPTILKLEPTSTVPGILMICGVPGTTVAVAVGIEVAVGVGVSAGVLAGVGVRVTTTLGIGVGIADGVGVGVAGACPTPVNATIRGPLVSLSLTVSVALRGPAAVGSKVIVIVQLAPAGSADGQELAGEKSPPAVTLDIDSAL